ncbi:MAG TPA: hypothetical protein PKE00_09780, partial [Planctomycetota bacterium]|nr:hypothetical protein [Planctomycetota bacterium]
MIAPSTRAVVTALAKDPLQDAEARLAACLLLESSSWPADFDALLRGGLVRSSENAERLLVILPPRFAANLARQIFEADDENLVLRGLSALERVDDAVLADFLTKVERLIPAARDRVARILLERLPKQTLQRSKFILESSVDVDFQEAWVEAVGERLARFREGRKVLLNLLRPAEAEERPRLADLAFKSCVAAQYYVPELAAHAGEDAQRLAVLSRLGTLVPSEFWIATLDSAATVDVQLRAVAALGMYAQTEAIAATLRGLATGPWRQCRVAALQAYLAVPEPHDLEGFLASVLRVADLGLDTALIEVLETSQRDFVRPALAYLASTRIAGLLLEARALHGDDEAARALFETFESLPMSRLRRLRDSIARALGPDDLDRIFQALDPGRRSASSWVLSEVFEWLALRPDAFPGEGPNSLDARLRAFAAREEDDELATAAHVLLVRRGQLDVLSETLDRWMREAAEEDEGRLLELLSVLPTDVGPRGVELAFDILAAPARDVAALLDFER